MDALEGTLGVEVPDEIRTIQLCEIFHCPPTVLDEQPGYLCDWALAYRRTVAEVQQRMANSG